MDLQTQDRMLINTLGRASFTAQQLLDLLYKQPIVSTPLVSRKLEISQPAARKAINNLESLGILKEISGKKRDKTYVYEAFKYYQRRFRILEDRLKPSL